MGESNILFFSGGDFRKLVSSPHRAPTYGIRKGVPLHVIVPHLPAFSPGTFDRWLATHGSPVIDQMCRSGNSWRSHEFPLRHIMYWEAASGPI